MPTAAIQTRAWTLPLPRSRTLHLSGRPRVMGVVNVTPDSFSDGGLWLEPERAVEHALTLLGEGAELIDLGAESTRPGGGVYGAGAREVSASEEADRLLPVLELLRRETEAPLSVDTRKGEVARQVLAAGADLINDVSAVADPELGRAVARAGCPLVLMHSRGELATMQVDVRFGDLLGEVTAELAATRARAEALGVSPEQVIVDPGLGFGKTAAQNLTLLRRLDALDELGRPVLVGASRKSFLGAVTGAPAAERLPESLAAAAWAAAHRAAIVRVHDVAQTVRFLDVYEAIARSEGGESV